MYTTSTLDYCEETRQINMLLSKDTEARLRHVKTGIWNQPPNTKIVTRD